MNFSNFSSSTFTKSFVLALNASAILSGCGSAPEKPNALEGTCIVESVEAPSWVCGTYHEEGAYLASGSARLSKLGFDFSRKEAMANARADLVNKIAIDVKAKVETYARSTGVESEWPERVVTQVSKQTSNVELKNVQQYSFWQNPKTQTIFVLVKVNPAAVKVKLDEALKQVQEESGSNQRWNAEDVLKGI